ncbi:MAG: hypothetical protein GY835_12720 [bacterium]|nr:hypothetical protein [bacterium]
MLRPIAAAVGISPQAVASSEALLSLVELLESHRRDPEIPSDVGAATVVPQSHGSGRRLLMEPFRSAYDRLSESLAPRQADPE